MNIEIKQKLKNLKKENKIKFARKEIVEDFKKIYDIDILNKNFIDYRLSENIHRKVYEKINTQNITTNKFYYEYSTADKNLIELFNIFSLYENNNILYYPSSFPFYVDRCNSLYLSFPVAIRSTIKDCKEMIFRLIHKIHEDIIIVDENLKYGFIIGEDEEQCVSIKYWGIRNR